MGEKKRGRPAKEPDDLITLDEAVAAIKQFLHSRFTEETATRRELSKKTLYNKRNLNEIYPYKKGTVALVSKAEVLKLVS